MIKFMNKIRQVEAIPIESKCNGLWPNLLCRYLSAYPLDESFEQIIQDHFPIKRSKPLFSIRICSCLSIWITNIKKHYK